MTERLFLCEALSDILADPVIRRMSSYIQHGQISTLDHCSAVTYYSLKVSRFLGLRMDYKSLVRGAFLHDFYLYDWHVPSTTHRLHGLSHSETALRNAKTFFFINEKEAEMIKSHMWPLTIRRLPRSKEAMVLCLVDKFCSLREIFRLPYRENGLFLARQSVSEHTVEALNGK